MNKFGFVRVTVCSPEVVIGNPAANVKNIKALLASNPESDVVVFPELSITSYTCADLFRQQHLLQAAEEAIVSLVEYADPKQFVIVGVPVRVGASLYNCAAVINSGQIIGIVPKQYVPTYNEFYEKRIFSAANGTEPKSILYAKQTIAGVPFGTDLLFQSRVNRNLIIGLEVCEDLFVPIPPSSHAALAGATLLVNLSASNETVAKNEYRMELIRNQSGRCLAAYAYASAGPTESTTDLVFSGHCVIAENGTVLVETHHIGDGTINLRGRCATADIDTDRLQHERQVQTSFSDQRNEAKLFRTVEGSGRFCTSGPIWHWFDAQVPAMTGLHRAVPGLPFVPRNPATLASRCAAIFDIQCAGLAQRMKSAGMPILNIGVSGGLDSTLALLVCHKTCQVLGLPPTHIHAKTMPGFGTTSKTKEIALTLMKELGVDQQAIDIRLTCLQMWKDMGHNPFGIKLIGDFTTARVEWFYKMLQEVPPEKRHDLVFENTQARVRTNFLMNSGFTVGTGDLSEIACGWMTYGGDHLSMFNPNCSIPKTLVKFLVEYVAKNQYDGVIRETLLKVVNLTISPELLPVGRDGEIEQSTEDVLGPYVLLDFYLWNFMRYGFIPEKILFLSEFADFGEQKFSREIREKTLHTFLKRFFSQQFKRDCVPGGPKVGSVALDSRCNHRMPADADPTLWLDFG